MILKAERSDIFGVLAQIDDHLFGRSDTGEQKYMLVSS